ncbi:MAG: HAD family hydrolase [Bacillota bacterium]
MLRLEIQGYEKPLEIEKIVFDYNGTLAIDGKMSQEVMEGIKALAEKGLELYILTADTYGSAREECKDLPIEIRVFDKGNGEQGKGMIVRELGGEKVASVGNGRIDILMLKEAALKIVVAGKEGAWAGLFQTADIVVDSPESAVGLFLNPERIVATLRK